MNERTRGPWAWEDRHDEKGKRIATLLVTEHRPVSCNDPLIFALREDWLGKLSEDREAAKQMVVATPRMLEALHKVVAVLEQIQEHPEQCRDIVAQGYVGHALVRARGAIAAATLAGPAGVTPDSDSAEVAAAPRFEKVASGRWLLRNEAGDRLGEVFGGNGRFQAQTMQGKFLGNAPTLERAAQLLQG